MERNDANEWRLLCETRFPDLQIDCGRTADAGVLDVDEWRDWSEFETTPDQQRIEDYISRFDLRGKGILHVGVGNSDLGRRFCRKAEFIVGTTIIDAELRKAVALGLVNYHVSLHNKYLEAGRPAEKYHLIVDNNPTTFCCCLKHFRVMMEWYARSLESGGQVVTERVGLGWTTELEPENSQWKFTFEDLQAVAPFFELRAYRVDENIYVLSKGQANIPAPPSRLAVLTRRFICAASSRVRTVVRRLRTT